MIMQVLPTGASDWLQYGAMGLLALVLVGVGWGMFQILKAYIAHIVELSRALSEMTKVLFELSKGMAILSEQTEALHTLAVKNQEILLAAQEKGFLRGEAELKGMAESIDDLSKEKR